MSNEHAEYINRCETAFKQFIDSTADFVNSEENNRSLIAALDRLGLTYDRASHLEIAFRSIKSKKHTTAAPPVPTVPQPESFETAVEREANRLLDSGEVTAEIVHRMGAKELERKSMDFAFVRALDLLEARRVKQSLRPADVAIAEARAGLNGTTLLTEVAKAESQMVAAHNRRPANASPAQRSSGIMNTHQGASYSTRRKPTLESALAQERKDQAFIDAANAKTARLIRVKANKGK